MHVTCVLHWTRSITFIQSHTLNCLLHAGDRHVTCSIFPLGLDLLLDKCSEVKENDDYIVGCNQVICLWLFISYFLYKQVDGINLLQIPARDDMMAYGGSLGGAVLVKRSKGHLL